MITAGREGPPDERTYAASLREVAFFLCGTNQWNENSRVDDNAPDSSRNQVAAPARARWIAVHVMGWRRDMMILLR